ncbi:outer membrane beta-barrel protein [Pseudoalteromonas piscicida]|uniref:TonB-dependent receptor n=1 Tax=Pseudoalteromonas piscicida TaxID=43662 RepID=A0A2A5JNC7_PSEO7|nr:outer membrane beta-barrel protein [Pseudoalteromonas piscicida]PCK30936.1 TonB-dependent receptor [Pseudoalteromonas piscicida]
MKQLTIAAALFATFGLSTAAHAESDFGLDDYKIYTGVGYGQYSFQWEDRENDTSFDDDSSMLKAYVGTKINPYWSIELGYENFDEVSDIDNSADIDGISLSTRLSAPLNEYFSVYAKGGWLEWDADVYADIPAVGRVSSSLEGGDWLYGAGVEFHIHENVNMRLEYTRYELEEDIDPDMDVAAVSIEYQF